MPVTTRGKKIVEKKTGKVVGTGKTTASAKASARIRNQKHREKMRRKGKK